MLGLFCAAAEEGIVVGPSVGELIGERCCPTFSKSGKGKTIDEYFIAPFSCPGSCISAKPYHLNNHLLDGAVTQCDASSSYQRWKVHQVDGFLKFESAAQLDQGMCLAVVHPDPDHESNLGGANNGALSGLVGIGIVGTDSGALSTEEVNDICTGQLGLAKCDHPGSYWYTTEETSSRPYAGIRVCQLP